MSSEDNKNGESGESINKRNTPESSSTQLGSGDAPAAKNNSADAQIQAHRKQHQQQKTKLFGGAGILVVIAIVALIAYYLVTASSDVKDKPIAVPDVQMSESDIAQFREAFKQALTQYEINIQPKIDEISLADFKSTQASELALLKAQAVSLFAQGAFAQAKQTIDSLSKKSNTLIDEWTAQIQMHVYDGQQAFANEEIPQAQLHVNKALALSPSNIPALELQNRIYAFGEASKLVQELKIAVFENNWPKQVEVITGIIEIDPERTELINDLEKAQAQHDMQQLTDYLAQAEAAIKANQLTKAEQLIKQAKAIKIDSRGAQALTKQIAQVRASQSARSALAAITKAATADSWEQVSKQVQTALLKTPNNTQLKRYQEQAQQVMSAKKSLANFIARPQRLADENIRQAASQAVQSSFAASLLSPSLQQQIEQVATSIDQYSSPVEIEINSDGNTYITVLGIGHVGEHKQKVIELTPGNYVLQGKRDGYRSKRLELIVKANTPSSITLICDERI